MQGQEKCPRPYGLWSHSGSLCLPPPPRLLHPQDAKLSALTAAVPDVPGFRKILPRSDYIIIPKSSLQDEQSCPPVELCVAPPQASPKGPSLVSSAALETVPGHAGVAEQRLAVEAFAEEAGGLGQPAAVEELAASEVLGRDVLLNAAPLEADEGRQPQRPRLVLEEAFARGSPEHPAAGPAGPHAQAGDSVSLVTVMRVSGLGSAGAAGVGAPGSSRARTQVSRSSRRLAGPRPRPFLRDAPHRREAGPERGAGMMLASVPEAELARQPVVLSGWGFSVSSRLFWQTRWHLEPWGRIFTLSSWAQRREEVFEVGETGRWPREKGGVSAGLSCPGPPGRALIPVMPQPPPCPWRRCRHARHHPEQEGILRQASLPAPAPRPSAIERQRRDLDGGGRRPQGFPGRPGACCGAGAAAWARAFGGVRGVGFFRCVLAWAVGAQGRFTCFLICKMRVAQSRGDGFSPLSLLFFFFWSFWPHVEVPRLGVESELQLPASTPATAAPDPNPLSRAGVEPASSWVPAGSV